MKKLIGSEKQIKWAEDIRGKRMNQFYKSKAKWEKSGRVDKEESEKWENFLKNIEQAEKWIEIEKQGVAIQFLVLNNDTNTMHTVHKQLALDTLRTIMGGNCEQIL